MTGLRSASDGVVMIRPPEPGDAARLIAGRDAEFHRWLGAGDPAPHPTGCIVVDDEVVGWVDYDLDRDWLDPGEVNVGYNVFAPHCGQGYASRAVELLVHHLADATEHVVATLLIDAQNDRSLALAARTGFVATGELGGNLRFARPLRPSGHQSVGV